jgi:hypothetical protein
MAQSIARIPTDATESHSQSEQGKFYNSLLIFGRDFTHGSYNAASCERASNFAFVASNVRYSESSVFELQNW